MCSSRGPLVMTSTQTSSKPTRRKSVYERFIKWPLGVEISFQLKLNLLLYNRRACTRQLLEKIKQSFSLFFFFELQQQNRNSSTNTSRLIFFHFKYQSTIPIYVLGKWKKIRVNTGAFFGNFLQLNTSEWPYFIKSKL